MTGLLDRRFGLKRALLLAVVLVSALATSQVRAAAQSFAALSEQLSEPNGDFDTDSLALWHLDKTDLTVRVPWSLLAFADPSSREVGVPRLGKLTFQTSPGVRVSFAASGTDQLVGQATWDIWTVPAYNERVKSGASQFRDAALSVTGG